MRDALLQGMTQLEIEDAVANDLKRATGEFNKDEAAGPGGRNGGNRLNRVLQLTGFSDPVYAEAYVTVHQYDIVLDVTVVNRTQETLQNLCLELATMGDLKLVERPQNYTLAPDSSKLIRANIKVRRLCPPLLLLLLLPHPGASLLTAPSASLYTDPWETQELIPSLLALPFCVPLPRIHVW